jgi:hypothetical protein
LKDRFPKLAVLDCAKCEEFQVDESWNFEIGRDGNPVRRLKELGVEFLAPCRDPARGCPKGTPEKQRTLNEDNQLCILHYQECKAVGEFPDDPVVRRNAALIEETQRKIDRSDTKDFIAAVDAVIKAASL